jgi:hypothetical protein
MCPSGHYWNSVTGMCHPNVSSSSAKSKTGVSIIENIGGILGGASSVIGALKGNSMAPVTNNYVAPSNGGNMIMIVIAIVAVLFIFLMMKK